MKNNKLFVAISVVLVAAIGFVLWGDASKTDKTLNLWQRFKNLFGSQTNDSQNLILLSANQSKGGSQVTTKTITTGETATYSGGNYYGLHVSVRDGEGTIAIGGGSAIPINTSQGYSIPKSETVYTTTAVVVCIEGTIDIVAYS